MLEISVLYKKIMENYEREIQEGALSVVSQLSHFFGVGTVSFWSGEHYYTVTADHDYSLSLFVDDDPHAIKGSRTEILDKIMTMITKQDRRYRITREKKGQKRLREISEVKIPLFFSW